MMHHLQDPLQLNKQNNIKASVSVAKEKLELYTMAGSARPYNHLEGAWKFLEKLIVYLQNDLAILPVSLPYLIQETSKYSFTQ